MKKKILIFGGTGLFGINFLSYFNKDFEITVNYNSKKFFHPNLKYIKVNLNKYMGLRKILKKYIYNLKYLKKKI